MTPQLQQAIRLLQLSTLDLHAEIQETLEKNPLLELSEESSSSDPREGKHDDEKSEDKPSESFETSWESQVVPSAMSSVKGNYKNDSDDSRSLEATQSEPPDLRAHCIWQMELSKFTPTDQLIALALIDGINEDGFLEASLDDILTTLQGSGDIERDEIEAVLKRIQQFDPIGVGSRNLKECLALQIKVYAQNSPWQEKALTLVEHHLETLAKQDLSTLKRRLGVSLDELMDIIKFVQSLDPKPGARLSATLAPYVVPDVVVYKKQGQWVLELNPECLPKLKIHSGYANLFKRSDTSSEGQYIRTHLQEAKWFLKSIENRNETLLKVAKCIMQEQHAFLEEGEESMKPLVLHDVAKAINMHESTVSRITSSKYIHTPRGTFELKFFFSSHVATHSGGECSATAIRAMIKKLVSKEDLKKPLSDSKLSNILAEKGIQVARRTVAKYRESLGIPPSNERKRLL